MAAKAKAARERATVIPAEQFDDLTASLDVADPAEQLAAAARKPSVFTRHGGRGSGNS